MATAAANDGPDFAPGDSITLNPNDIELGERLRPIDNAWATAIGQSMQRDGQIHEVSVRPLPSGGWLLVGAGGHRVTGARLAGIPIEAKVLLIDDDTARRREAAENLFRRANDPIERAEAIAELVRLHRERAGIEEAGRRDVRTPKRLRDEVDDHMETISMCYGWSEEIGAEIGLTGRTIRNDLFLYRGLLPSVVQRLRVARHSALKNASQLRALAKLGPDQQRAAADLMIECAHSLSDAIAKIVHRPRPSAEDKRLSAFIGTFNRMTLAEQRGALSHLAGMIPAPWKLVEDK